MTPLSEDVAIPLGPPGSCITVTCPRMAGGRIYFSCDEPLKFFLNPGPALVEPSVLNTSDPNYNINHCFCEFTLNQDQLFANISCVDMCPALPVSLTLQDNQGAVQHVSGMPADGLDKVCAKMCEQARKDGMPWDKLIVRCRNTGAPVRVLNPTHGEAVGANFGNYFDPMVDKVWSKYSAAAPAAQRCAMRINTQAAAGWVTGSIDGKGRLVFGDPNGECFPRPTTADILGCNSGTFQTGPSGTRNAIIPRLAAGFIRGTLLDTTEHPADPSLFYKRDPTNHYCRIVHECHLDGKGYAFAYDDVQPDNGADQSGKVNCGDPKVFIVSVGGRWAYTGDRMPAPGAGLPPGP
jgi:hypothetical protein